MRIGALFGWGIVIYAITTLSASTFVIYGLQGSFIARIGILLSLVIVAIVAGRSLRRPHWSDILVYSFAWAFIAAALDAVYVVPFAGWEMYADWNVWLGYSLVFLVPLFAPMTYAKKEVARSN